MNHFAFVSTLALFSAAALPATAQSAEEDEDSGWFEEAPAAEEDEATAESEAPAVPARPAPEAKPAAAGKIEVDPARDRRPTDRPKKKKGVRLHDGLYLRGALGGGSVAARGYRTDADGNRSEYDFQGDAFATDLMLGFTPKPGIVIGGGYFANHAGRTREESGPDGDPAMSFGMIGPFVDYFPDPRNGFHLGGAVGPAATVSYDPGQMERHEGMEEDPVVAFGFGGSLWLGYDFWIADQWSLGVNLRGTAARVKSYDYESEDRPMRAHDRLGAGSVALLVSALYH